MYEFVRQFLAELSDASRTLALIALEVHLFDDTLFLIDAVEALFRVEAHRLDRFLPALLVEHLSLLAQLSHVLH